MGPFGDIGQADHGENLTTTVQERRFKNARTVILQGISDEHRYIGCHGERCQHPHVHCEDYRRDASNSHISRYESGWSAKVIALASVLFRCIRLKRNTH